jgi:2-keto-3-deoxy-L-rhamnonate aldolase RhmA
VDVLFIGTSDLSFSLGLRGQQDDPKLDAAIGRIVEAGQRHGKFLGRPAATPEIAKRYMELGFLLFQGPTDLGLMGAGARRYLDAAGRAQGTPQPRALY